MRIRFQFKLVASLATCAAISGCAVPGRSTAVGPVGAIDAATDQLTVDADHRERADIEDFDAPQSDASDAGDSSTVGDIGDVPSVDATDVVNLVDVPDRPLIVDVQPNLDAAMGTRTIRGRIRFLNAPGSITLRFNSVTSTFAARHDAMGINESIPFELNAPAPAGANLFQVLTQPANQLCTVRLPVGVSPTATLIGDAEVRCVIAEQRSVSGNISIPVGGDMAMPLPTLAFSEINLSDEADVALTYLISSVSFADSATARGVLHFGVLDQVTGMTYGWAVERSSGASNRHRLNYAQTIHLQRGIHRLVPVVKNFDAPGSGNVLFTSTVGGFALPMVGTLVVHDSLSSFDRGIQSTWLPTGMESIPLDDPPLTMTFNPPLELVAPPNSFAVMTLQSAQAHRAPRWEAMLNNSTVAIGTSSYFDMIAPHALMAVRQVQGGSARLTGQVTHMAFTNAMQVNGDPLLFEPSWFGTRHVGRTPLTPVNASLSIFRPGSNIASGNFSLANNMLVTTADVWESSRRDGTLPEPELSLSEPRQVLVFAQITAARFIGGDNVLGRLRIAIRNGAVSTSLIETLVVVASSDASEGVTLAAIATLDRGTYQFSLEGRVHQAAAAMVYGHAQTDMYSPIVRMNIAAIPLE